jgi:hypothetical protein
VGYGWRRDRTGGRWWVNRNGGGAAAGEGERFWRARGLGFAGTAGGGGQRAPRFFAAASPTPVGPGRIRVGLALNGLGHELNTAGTVTVSIIFF